jgi:hypothetical protein
MPETQLMVPRPTSDDIIKSLVEPGASLPKGVEEALFGSSMHELGGIEPTQVRSKEIQYRLIEHLLHRLAVKIKSGERDQLAPQIRFAREVIADQLMGILAQVLQAYEARVITEQRKKKNHSRTTWGQIRHGS